MSLWRQLFPKYKCRPCKDSGVLDDGLTVSVCHHCRDLETEIRAAVKALVKCDCQPFSLETQRGNGRVVCIHCGTKWGDMIV